MSFAVFVSNSGVLGSTQTTTSDSIKKEENLQGSPLFYAVKYLINTSLSCRQRCKPDP